LRVISVAICADISASVLIFVSRNISVSSGVSGSSSGSTETFKPRALASSIMLRFSIRKIVAAFFLSFSDLERGSIACI
jgi:hypothetical protein